MGQFRYIPSYRGPHSNYVWPNRMIQIIPVWKSVRKGENSLKEIENETQILGTVKIDQVTCSCLDQLSEKSRLVCH